MHSYYQLYFHAPQVQQCDADIKSYKEQLAYLLKSMDKQVKDIIGLENDIHEANEKIDFAKNEVKN